MTRIALHVHTEYSFDSQSKVPDILEYCRRHDINYLAITDHDTLDGYFAASQIDQTDVKLIPGVEITTKEGIHVIGLNVKYFESGLDISTTIASINSQGGIVYFPHPRRYDGVFAINDWINILNRTQFLVEGYNAKNDDINDIKPLELERLLKNKLSHSNFRVIEGSDAHRVKDIGSVILSVERGFNPINYEAYVGEFIRKERYTRKITLIYYRLNLNRIIPKKIKEILKYFWNKL